MHPGHLLSLFLSCSKIGAVTLMSNSRDVTIKQNLLIFRDKKIIIIVLKEPYAGQLAIAKYAK